MNNKDKKFLKPELFDKSLQFIFRTFRRDMDMWLLKMF